MEDLERRLLYSSYMVGDASDAAGSSTDITLRYAVGMADSASAPSAPTTITFASTVTSITLAEGALQLSNTQVPTIISGLGVSVLAIGGNGASAIFDVQPSVTVTISSMTITDGSAEGGGGIFNNGNLTVTACAVTSCTASDNGGGIENFGGTHTMSQCTLSGDSANSETYLEGSGGGVFNSSGGSATLTACTINGDSAGSLDGENGYGGGVYSSGTLSLEN
jgi:hypothetical protein